jgi:hypothetical protein
VDLNFHGTDDRLEEYVFGRLPRPDLPAFEEHLLICVACRDRLDAMEAITVGMKQAVGASQAVSKSTFSRADWFPWLRRPAFFMALASVALIAAISIDSNSITKFAPVATLELTASRGGMPLAGPARELDLTLSDAPREEGAVRVEVVNSTGQAIWNGVAGSGAAGIRVKAERQFGPGDYFVRLYSVSGKMLREYGFRIRPW